MNEELLKIRSSIKAKRFIMSNPVVSVEKKTSSWLSNYALKLMFTVVLTLTVLISLKANSKFKTFFYQQVYTKNFSFATLNELYQAQFGSPIPFKDLLIDNTKQVFNEQLTYSDASKYKDGVKLIVANNYLVPAKSNGLVIFVGNKDGYGQTIIIQQTNGIEVWYSNLETLTVSLYDYIDAGDLIGGVKDDYLYMVFQKDGTFLNYEDYI
jgi:stage IV sporulation protein FA